MIPSQHLKTKGQEPWERFITTYNSDYRPFSERYLQVNQLNPGTEAEAAPAFIPPPQLKRETWPIFYHYFYKTTNSTYGSTAQPPSYHLFHAPPSTIGILTPSVSVATGVVGSTLTEGRTQDARVARETGHSLGVEKNGQLHCVCGGKGAIVVSSHVAPACCEDFLKSVCREAGLQHLLHFPVASSPIVTNKDAENWENGAYMRGLRPAVGLRNSSGLEPTSRQCSCFAGETERPKSCCFEMQTLPAHIPLGSTRPLAHIQPTVSCTEPNKEPLLTEYQASYSAEWPQPKIQLRDYNHRHLPCHWNPHSSL
ncbi:uncharacterized protein LOC130164868 isoform X2 [Seriola aureovittata]|uniref:uncharacterized protein LOC130164868 isoform X2 n=1 Tax=Seriola aureovittata TaxID=2871759 RepID=UPI0024BDC010|nr:uncharacterized protein LOC130164868 isoform X2 [Seriola aureovittata]